MRKSATRLATGYRLATGRPGVRQVGSPEGVRPMICAWNSTAEPS